MKTSKHDITFTKGDSYALDIVLKGATESLRLAYFTVKESISDASVIRKEIGNGIELKEERKYKDEIIYRLSLSPSDTQNLMSGFSYLYDLQLVFGNVVNTPIFGFLTLEPSVSSAISLKTETLFIADDKVDCYVRTTDPTVGIEVETDPIATRLIGDMSSLSTQDKTTIVGALNEINAEKQDINVPSLTTVAKTVPLAINEINAKYEQYKSDISYLEKQISGINTEIDLQEQLMDSQNQLILANDAKVTELQAVADDIKQFLGLQARA